ncbi:MAG: hypothetical protein MRY49_00795 [Candidatus Pacebacteria bacterium]|nr:hypothetical protein [Candidatus Paceibacterota bacterium]
MVISQDKLNEYLSHPAAFWFAFFIVIGIFALMTIFLLYHWEKYGKDSMKIALAELVYLVGAASFVAIAAFSLTMYTIS